MDTPEARNYQAFQEDFTNGGWDSFLNPGNSFVDVFFDNADKLDKSVSTAQQNVENERIAGNGFLDMKKCVQFEDVSLLQNYIKSCDQSNSCGVVAYQDAVNKVAAPACLRYETVTPGFAIAAQVEAVSTTHIRQLEQADQINEVLGAFFDQLLNKLFAFGLSSVGERTNNQWGFGGLGSNVVFGTNGQVLSSASAGVLGYQDTDGSGIADFDVSRPQQLRAIVQTQYNYLNHALDAHIALNRILPTLGALDYCVPGPNPTWQDGLSDNAQAYFGNLQEVQKGTSKFAQLAQSIPIIGGLFGGGESHTIAAVGTQLFDKASGQTLPISDTVYHESNRSTGVIFENVQLRYGEVLNFYKANYTKDNIKNAFLGVDPSNSALAAGFVEDAFAETANLPTYSQALLASELEGSYNKTETETRDAIIELEAIRGEVNQIVGTAKSRYIAEQAAAGTPVNQSCIDTAYKIDTSPLTITPRQESDTPSPFVIPAVDASSYFYTQL